MIRVLCIGFGRMGLSHLTILSGMIGRNQLKVSIADPSLTSRLIAKFLFPDGDIFGTRCLKKQNYNYDKYDYIIVCTPPSVRDEILDQLGNFSGFIFIEKPVLIQLPSNSMSGYVLQHCALNDEVRYFLVGQNIREIEASLISNLDFSSVGTGWRSGRFGGILHEFGGHVLSVIGACLPEKNVYNTDPSKLNITVVEYDRNSVVFHFIDNETKIRVNLFTGSNLVRKAAYEVKFVTENSTYIYDLYSLKDYDRETTIFGLASSGASCDYYVRGFEFSNQMEAFLSKDGDVMTGNQIECMEKIITYIETNYGSNYR